MAEWVEYFTLFGAFLYCSIILFALVSLHFSVTVWLGLGCRNTWLGLVKDGLG